jgi:hypothetical protein
MFLEPLLHALRVPVPSSASPRFIGARSTSSPENHPAVQSGSAPFASTTRLDPDGVGRALHNIAQSDCFIGYEAWQSHLIRL